MDRPKTITPNYLIKRGLIVYECKICKRVFPSLMPLSQHVLSQHQLTLIVKDTRKKKHEVGDDDDDDDDHEDEDDEEDSDSDSDRYEEVDEDDESDEDDVVEDGKEAWITDDNIANALRPLLDSALEYINNKDGGKKYEFVQQGPYVATIHHFRHLNFQAKEKDRPDAPVETLFAQIRFGPDKRVDCCVSLGPSNELPHWRKANLGGCKLCSGMVNHPLEMVDNLRLI
ncbi:uncharacterized protein LOC141632556 [Silene latifolia]|uniref:uncharacterized protein LOC141632556 n=1 Tax=Silene latifolia TaxID=37657 RepID=UPI003D77438F